MGSVPSDMSIAKDSDSEVVITTSKSPKSDVDNNLTPATAITTNSIVNQQIESDDIATSSATEIAGENEKMLNFDDQEVTVLESLSSIVENVCTPMTLIKVEPTNIPTPDCRMEEDENETEIEGTKEVEVQINAPKTKDSSKQIAKKCGTVEVFKKPAAPFKKKRKVLEEDKYAEELEKIVQRDFFPDLEKLKAQNAYLNAVENNDIHMLRELYSKYTFGMKSPLVKSGGSLLETPSTFETPLEMRKQTPVGLLESTPTHLPMESPSRAKDDDAKSVSSKCSSSRNQAKNMSLNAFLDNYTSEDNHSFQDIMEESERKHRVKFAWLYEAEKTHDEKLKASLALPSMEKQAEEYKRPLDVDTWSYTNKNYIMYVPAGVPFTPEEEIQMAKKRAEVIFENTRYKVNPFKQQTVIDTTAGGKPTNLFKPLEGKIGVDGKEVESDTPKVNGFSYVRTPSPTPGVEESPFMTWGEIEGTPFRLDGGDTPVPATPIKPFRMLEQSKRERIAIELAEKVSQRYRDKKQKAMDAARSHLATPSPRPQSVLDRLSTMSPAAQKFAKSKLGSRLTSDRALRASYTPSRASTPSSSCKTPTPSIRSTLSSKTPTYGSTPGKSTHTPLLSNMTDNLLQLPKSSTRKRTTAAEFF